MQEDDLEATDDVIYKREEDGEEEVNLRLELVRSILHWFSSCSMVSFGGSRRGTIWNTKCDNNPKGEILI